MYKVYLSGSSNPVWQYKRYGNLVKRLNHLAYHTSIRSVLLVYPDGEQAHVFLKTFTRISR